VFNDVVGNLNIVEGEKAAADTLRRDAGSLNCSSGPPARRLRVRFRGGPELQHQRIRSGCVVDGRELVHELLALSVITPGGNSNLATSLSYNSSWAVTSVTGANGRPTSSKMPDGATARSGSGAAAAII